MEMLVLFALLSAQDWSQVDRIAQQHLAKDKTPGAAIAVVRGERIAHERGFGTANVETGELVTPEHLFRAGSTTKMMVAASLLKLAEDNGLLLTGPVGSHIPGLDPAIGRLTGHQLLTHTSGLLDKAPMYGPQDDSALAANVAAWKQDMFFTEPGQVYSYSNPGYALAGRLVEAVAGKPFADAVADLIFKPAGMSRTTFRPTVAMTYPLAQGHVDGAIARPAGNNAAYWPAGSMFTSVRDFARFAMALLHGGAVEGKAVLSADAVKRMTTPHVKVAGASEGHYYGYGLSVDPDFGVIEHSGSRIGYASHFVMHPKDRLAVIVLMNRSGADAAGLARAISDFVLGQKPAPRRLPASHHRNLSSYEGVYKNGESVITVKAAGAEDLAIVIEPGRTITAAKGSGNCFEGKQANVCFSPDARYLHSGSRAYARQP